jgi:hypothetical protein
VKYVLDSSVALKWALPESDSGKAIRLRDEYRNGIHALLSVKCRYDDCRFHMDVDNRLP